MFKYSFDSVINLIVNSVPSLPDLVGIFLLYQGDIVDISLAIPVTSFTMKSNLIFFHGTNKLPHLTSPLILFSFKFFWSIELHIWKGQKKKTLILKTNFF